MLGKQILVYAAAITGSVGLGMTIACSEVTPLQRPSLQKDEAGDVRDVPPPAPPDSQPIDSVAAFKKETYPLLVAWCGSCHASLNGPYFAQEDARASHDTLVSSTKVDLKAPEKSRIYVRVAAEDHHCPDAKCDAAAAKLLEALKQWAREIKADQIGKDTAKTASLGLTAAEQEFQELALPAEAIRFEAESAGAIRPPMRVVGKVGGSGGKVLGTPAGAGSELRAEVASTSQTLGSATYAFEVKNAGNYRLVGRVQGPSAQNSSFYIRFDNGPLVVWDIPVTGADFAFHFASPPGGDTPQSFNLTAGPHKLEVLHREEQTAVDTLALVADPSLEPTTITKFVRTLRTLTFDLDAASGIPGAKLSVDIGGYNNDEAYLFKNLRITLPQGALRIKGIRPLINGNFSPVHATFILVDLVVKAPGAQLSSATLVALKEKGLNADQFGFTFDILEGQP